MLVFVRASSSSVPIPALVAAGGTAGTRASGFDAVRCDANFPNSECVRRTSRNCVVLNFGRFVCKTGQQQIVLSALVGFSTHINIKLQNGILLPTPLQPCNLGLQLILRHMLPLLRRHTMISCRLWPPILLAGRWSLLLTRLLVILLRAPAATSHRRRILIRLLLLVVSTRSSFMVLVSPHRRPR